MKCTKEQYQNIGGIICSSCKFSNNCEFGKYGNMIRKMLEENNIKVNDKNMKKAMEDTKNISYDEIKEYFSN